MSHFAEISGSGSGSITYTVINVIVAEQDFINKIGGTWVQTSYNTKHGVHYGMVSGSYVPDGGIQLRKNYAGKGYTYDKSRDAFIKLKPYASWILDEDSCLWEAPVSYPDDDKDYSWDEDGGAWVEETK